MQVEARVVRPPDTVVDPWAVMIVALHAAIAYVTVATLWQTNDLAERAKRLRIERLHQRDELDLFAALDVA